MAVHATPLHRASLASGKVSGAVPSHTAKLPLVGDVGRFRSVVSGTQGLAVANRGRSAAGVWVDVVSLKPIGDGAPTSDQPEALASHACPVHDDRSVATGEPALGIARCGG